MLKQSIKQNIKFKDKLKQIKKLIIFSKYYFYKNNLNFQKYKKKRYNTKALKIIFKKIFY